MLLELTEGFLAHKVCLISASFEGAMRLVNKKRRVTFLKKTMNYQRRKLHVDGWGDYSMKLQIQSQNVHVLLLTRFTQFLRRTLSNIYNRGFYENRCLSAVNAKGSNLDVWQGSECVAALIYLNFSTKNFS